MAHAAYSDTTMIRVKLFFLFRVCSSFAGISQFLCSTSNVVGQSPVIIIFFSFFLIYKYTIGHNLKHTCTHLGPCC